MVRACLAALCAAIPLQAAPQDQDSEPRIEEVEFVSHGAVLAGSLVTPRSGRAQAAVVFIHGSGRQTRNMKWARRFAQEGIAALVYDKRGAGRSGGQYEGKQNVSEKNLTLLADDAAAALEALAKRPSLDGVPLGFAGISQAGWIAPLAARKSRRAAFLVLWSAPVCKVSEEDIYSRYTADTDGAGVPSYRQALESRREAYVWPGFLGRDTDSRADLERLTIPGLWIFGDADGSIPVDLSIDGLKALRQGGRRYEYLLVPGLGHENMDETFVAASLWIKRLVSG
jgi:pimeloyl-ACP methyl ester carboxylesterase